MRTCSRYAHQPIVQTTTELISSGQCAIPVFEGLLSAPGHDEILTDLLFELATWHALAKLRLHTESTVVALEHSTQRLGKAIRIFEEKLCAEYIAGKLPGDDAPRAKGKAKAVKTDQVNPQGLSGDNAPRAKGKAKAVETGQADENKRAGGTKAGAKSKKVYNLNLKTYKLHALGHYAQAIRHFGPSDGYSTQAVSSSKL